MCESEMPLSNQSRRRGPRAGFVLLLTLVVMIVLGTITAALIFALSTDFRRAKIDANDAKAFWLAEAGMADAVRRLQNSTIVLSDGQTDNSTIQNVSLGDGTYSVTLARSGSEVTLTSVGTVHNQTRTLRAIMTMHFPRAFDFTVFGNNRDDGTLNIGNNNAATVVISGNLHFDRSDSPTPQSDTVNVRNSSQVIDGLVYSDSVTGGGTYTAASGPADPVPEYDIFDHTDYDAIFTAMPGSVSNLALSGSSTLTVSGVMYYKGITIEDNASLTGSGTIVAKNGITIKENATVGPNINIWADGNIVIRDSVTVAQGGTIYGHSDVTLRDDVTVTSSILANYVSGAAVVVKDDATLTGIIYAESANLSDNAVINGSVVANKYTSNRIANNVHITFDESYLPTGIPNGFDARYSQKANSWQEL